MLQFEKKEIENCLKSDWDLGNDVLYKLCSKNFTHTNKSEVLAKTWLIGRAYAAAIERRTKNLEIENDHFYSEVIFKKINESKLDSLLLDLSNFHSINEDSIDKITSTHHYLCSSLKEITGLYKRSFCSKYLHFHLPQLYFIYDSRAKKSLSALSKSMKTKNKISICTGEYDTEYKEFVTNCLALRKQVHNEYGIELTTRQLDNFLLMYKVK